VSVSDLEHCKSQSVSVSLSVSGVEHYLTHSLLSVSECVRSGTP